ncbi:uncharacterized protein BJ171DRAFT_593663 [Polychytrium aggregatum]|uniref:uncharacterized protein n=1 Tax=Polychytrium aggregatum TaxID=110093 RepID=UPI0022FDF6B8|nr:uncharacterized protein BJ171DRAFT_593663 [Polychytrium aggregatum]KAI9183782.1 hypothetical protein BJ171DRAFT_593663 [Polychytrium aggregatum]
MTEASNFVVRARLVSADGQEDRSFVVPPSRLKEAVPVPFGPLRTFRPPSSVPDNPNPAIALANSTHIQHTDGVNRADTIAPYNGVKQGDPSAASAAHKV